jgi:hypothetical protein
MSTIHLRQTTTSTPEQFLPGLPTSGRAARSSLETAPTSTSRCITRAPKRPTSPRAPAASGNACLGASER